MESIEVSCVSTQLLQNSRKFNYMANGFPTSGTRSLRKTREHRNLALSNATWFNGDPATIKVAETHPRCKLRRSKLRSSNRKLCPLWKNDLSFLGFCGSPAASVL